MILHRAVSAELVGTALGVLGVLLIDTANGLREIEELFATRISSPDRSVALEGVRIARERGWLTFSLERAGGKMDDRDFDFTLAMFEKYTDLSFEYYKHITTLSLGLLVLLTGVSEGLIGATVERPSTKSLWMSVTALSIVFLLSLVGLLMIALSPIRDNERWLSQKEDEKQGALPDKVTEGIFLASLMQMSLTASLFVLGIVSAMLFLAEFF